MNPIADFRVLVAKLDQAFEKCYRKEPFTSDRERVEFLFALYEKLANPLTAEVKPKRTRKPKAND